MFCLFCFICFLIFLRALQVIDVSRYSALNPKFSTIYARPGHLARLTSTLSQSLAGTHPRYCFKLSPLSSREVTRRFSMADGAQARKMSILEDSKPPRRRENLKYFVFLPFDQMYYKEHQNRKKMFL